jgi:hypothetical protein
LILSTVTSRQRATFSLPEPERYQIRPLLSKDTSAVSAILAHGDAFDSLLMTPIHHTCDKPQRAYDLWQASQDMVRSYISRGLSHGVFDI